MQEQRGERACTGSSRQRLRPLRSLLRRLTPKAACGCWPSSQRQSVRGASARCCESCGPRRAFRHGRGSQDARRVHAEREGKRGPESIGSPRGPPFLVSTATCTRLLRLSLYNKWQVALSPWAFCLARRRCLPLREPRLGAAATADASKLRHHPVSTLADRRESSRYALCSPQVQRCTYRRRKSFNTASNNVRKVKTPGGELKLHYVGKKGSGPRCGDCKKKLHGVRACTRPARTEEEAAMAAMAALRAL